MIDGTKIKLGEKEYVIPALTFGQLKRHMAAISKLAVVKPGGIPTQDQMGALIEVVRAALERNYPGISVEEVEEAIDLRTVSDVVLAVMGQSGLTPTIPGEVPAGS